MRITSDLLELAINAALKAGAAIMSVYAQDFAVEIKTDESPLTLADVRAHEAILLTLGKDIPILSEEGTTLDYDTRRHWSHFWLIDPLDGTREFVRKNGEFTVNIALIRHGEPVLGVVFAPVLRKLYYSVKGQGAFCCNVLSNQSGQYDLLQASRLPQNRANNQFTIVASRSHMTDETSRYIENQEKIYGSAILISSGSSLKICLVADGQADLYPRLAPTMEWDTAAADAIAREAGCVVTDFHTGQPLAYNKPALLNPWFIVRRSFNNTYD